MRAFPLEAEAIDYEAGPTSSGVVLARSPGGAPRAADPRVGSVLGRYYIEACIGSAALGTVYRASHVHTRKLVAIKILHPELSRSSDHALRFEREAVTTGRINHPNVVRASDFERLPDGSMYLVLEHVSGTNLRDFMADGALPPLQALAVAAELAQALKATHAAGVIHRFVKPENILLATRADSLSVKLTDFGLSAFDLQHECDVITQVGATIGTPEYMAPEQVTGQWYDQRADLYALGVVLYEMLAGRVPFAAESAVRVLEMHLDEEPEVLPETVHPKLRELVSRLLMKQPEQRLQNADEVLTELENAAAEVAKQALRARWSLSSLFRRGT